MRRTGTAGLGADIYDGLQSALSLDWSADANNNGGLGVIIDHVRIACDTP